MSNRLARSAVLAGVLLALAALVGVLLVAWQSRRAALESGAERTRLLARVLEDQATRTVDSASLALSTVAETLQAQRGDDPGRLAATLSQTAAAQPYLRTVALLDDQGRVLASSTARDVGRQIAFDRWGPVPPMGTPTLMLLQPGRGLSDGAAIPQAAQIRDIAFLPLVLRLNVGSRPLMLVALINPDAFANYQQSTIEGHGQAALFSYAGQLLTATSGLSLAPGSWHREHHLFRNALPAQDHGDWRGIGFTPGPQLVAYRVSRSRPLVVVVEQSEREALAGWRDGLWWDLLAAVVLETLIISATLVTLRSLHARARARRKLDEAHHRIAASEREMAVVLRSVQELIFRTDAQGRLSFVNARWALVTTAAPEQVMGRTVAELTAEPDRERVAALFAPGERSGIRSTEATFLTPNAEPRRFAVAVVPLSSGDQVTGYAGSAVDVTERFAAESRLQHQLDLVALLLELSPQPTSMVDREGRYVRVNRAWEQFTGRSRHDVIGHQVQPPMPEADDAPESSDWVPLAEVRGRSLLRYETQLRDRDRDCRDVVVSKVVVPDEHRQPAGVLFTLTDVSEFRRAERAILEAKEAAEEASRVKSEFIANISHELRTPLQSIIGYSELGMSRGQAVAPKLHSMFEAIHGSGQRMLTLVNDLLDVAKFESAVGTFDMERCDLRAQVTSVVRELDPLLQARGLRVDLDQSIVPLIVRLDPLRFQQVVRNVLANAIRFSPAGSLIDLRTEATPQGEAHVAVLDRGPGIPEPELETIFEAFVQSSATKDGSGGTGLGLAISRKIMTMLDGRIHAGNRPGGGAVFHLHLPLRPAADSGFGLL
ncbi:ATP-binding protein [Roseateles amylovorans]|uniref:histidine kinase n=1 Tax=Roseateles amylovorans TaxID=2978473 RepID=A0ABY6AU18_9BURK|nr:ATP-binding protein [Roseateles amylovorans]UXH76512.1 ATP-binding protein [Roseateles amylovorans]